MFDLTTYILSREFATALVDKQAGKTIETETSSGHIDEEGISKLRDSDASLIKADGKLYRLSRVEGSNYKYLNTHTDGSSQIAQMTEIDLNINTGDFTLKDVMIEGAPVEELRRLVESHINNTEVHVSSADREEWNSRVKAEVPQGTELLTLVNQR